MNDALDRIIAYEQGDLDEDEVIELFQDLVWSGLAWQLQGHYGRTAADLINRGMVSRQLPPGPDDFTPGYQTCATCEQPIWFASGDWAEVYARHRGQTQRFPHATTSAIGFWARDLPHEVSPFVAYFTR